MVYRARINFPQQACMRATVALDIEIERKTKPHRARKYEVPSSTVIFQCTRGADSTKLSKIKCVPALNGLALPHTSHSGKITLAGRRRLRSALAVAPVLFAQTLAIMLAQHT